MLSFAFWMIIILIALTVVAIPTSAHKDVEITGGLAAGTALLTLPLVWVSIVLFQQHPSPTMLVWAALIYMVGGSIFGLVRIFLKIGHSTYYSNAYMAWVVIDAAISIAALFILRG